VEHQRLSDANYRANSRLKGLAACRDPERRIFEGFSAWEEQDKNSSLLILMNHQQSTTVGGVVSERRWKNDCGQVALRTVGECE